MKILVSCLLSPPFWIYETTHCVQVTKEGETEKHVELQKKKKKKQNKIVATPRACAWKYFSIFSSRLVRCFLCVKSAGISFYEVPCAG